MSTAHRFDARAWTISEDAPMTPDLIRLRTSLDELGDFLAEFEFEYIDDPAWAEPSDTSYLNDADRADPDIMDNVTAMTSTNRLIAWFGKDAEGFVGLWRTSAQLPVEGCQVVRLDREGQYSLVAATVPDYIAISVPESSFAATREALITAGFSVSPSRDAIWSAVEKQEEPNTYRNDLYNQGRIRRGLKAI
jgi:hypothetical protein